MRTPAELAVLSSGLAALTPAPPPPPHPAAEEDLPELEENVDEGSRMEEVRGGQCGVGRGIVCG